MPLNALRMTGLSLKTQHQIAAVVINKVSLFKKISNLCKREQDTKTDIFIAVISRCCCWNLLILLCYLCRVFFYFTKYEK